MTKEIIDLVRENKFVSLTFKPFGEQIQVVAVVRTSETDYVPPMNLIIEPENLEGALTRMLEEMWAKMRRSQRKAAKEDKVDEMDEMDKEETAETPVPDAAPGTRDNGAVSTAEADVRPEEPETTEEPEEPETEEIEEEEWE